QLNDSIQISCEIGYSWAMFQYGVNKGLIKADTVFRTDTSISEPILPGTEFIKFLIKKTDDSDISAFTRVITITAYFPNNVSLFTKNERHNNGAINVECVVNAASEVAPDSHSVEIQDVTDLRVNYGVLR